MTELIKITTNESGNQVVSARELHEFLESKQEFANWIKNRIDKYGFVENQDFEVFDNFINNPNGGRPLKEYALTIDTAKELAMVEGNEKGRQARRYFIECEKKLRDVVSNQQLYIPKTLPEALRAYADEVEKNIKLEEKVKELEPKGQYFDKLVDRVILTNFRDTAKELGLGQNAFISKLIELRYIYRDSKKHLKPYSKFVKDGLFEIKEFTNSHTSGVQTLVTPKGREVFLRLIKGVQAIDLKLLKG
jgi:anti-repressor protein|nr:MAG TPA: KilAC domain protein [Caudoviricetes sp.]